MGQQRWSLVVGRIVRQGGGCGLRPLPSSPIPSDGATTAPSGHAPTTAIRLGRRAAVSAGVSVLHCCWWTPLASPRRRLVGARRPRIGRRLAIPLPTSALTWVASATPALAPLFRTSAAAAVDCLPQRDLRVACAAPVLPFPLLPGPCGAPVARGRLRPPRRHRFGRHGPTQGSILVGSHLVAGGRRGCRRGGGRVGHRRGGG